jgi:hypothetical protein
MDEVTNRGPALAVSARIDSAVADLLLTDDRAERISELIARVLAEIMIGLNVPGTPAVELSAADAPGGDARIELRIDDRESVFPLAIRYAVGRLYGEPDMEMEDLSPEALTDAVCLAVAEVIRGRPDLLLGRGQVSGYRGLLDLDQAAVPTSDEWLRSVVAPVLTLGISMSHLGDAREAVLAGWQRGSPAEDLAENLIETLAPRTIEIHVPTGDLRAFTLDADEQDRLAFQNATKELLSLLGVKSPPFSFVRSESLPTTTFAFRVNHVMCSPWKGLAPNELFAAAPAPSVTSKRPLLNPIDGSSGVVVDRDVAGEFSGYGFPILTPVEYVAASLLHEIRSRAHWCVRRSTVASQLEESSLLFPELVWAVRRRFSDDQIARVLRELLREDIPVRDMQWILERLLAFEWARVDSVRTLVVNDVLPILHRSNPSGDPEALAAFVRAGISRPLVERLGRSQEKTSVHVLDPRLEEDICERLRSSPDEGEIDGTFEARVREAILETTEIAAFSTPHALLVSSFEVRSLLRELVPLGWLRLPIVSRMELPRNVEIDPVGTVSLGNEA